MILMCLQGLEDTLLVQMPALRRASITVCGCCHSDSVLRIEQGSFVGAAKLESLVLSGPANVTLMTDSFSMLAELTTVELEACGLSSIPAALTALSGSLTRLALPRNHALQVADEDIKTFLALPQLQMLDLRKRAPQAAVTYEGLRMTELAPWSMRSLQRLCNLQATYHAQHGRLVALEMYYEDEEKSGYDSDSSKEQYFHFEAGGWLHVYDGIL